MHHPYPCLPHNIGHSDILVQKGTQCYFCRTSFKQGLIKASGFRSVSPSVSRLSHFVYTKAVVHSNDLFSETTASLNLRCHMQRDQTTRLQNNEIQCGREWPPKEFSSTPKHRTNSVPQVRNRVP